MLIAESILKNILIQFEEIEKTMKDLKKERKRIFKQMIEIEHHVEENSFTVPEAYKIYKELRDTYRSYDIVIEQYNQLEILEKKLNFVAVKNGLEKLLPTLSDSSDLLKRQLEDWEIDEGSEGDSIA